MASPAQTIRIFGVYLLLLAITLLFVPNLLMQAVGAPLTTDVWVRITGMLVGLLGFYYLRAASIGLSVFYHWSVQARLSVLGFLGAFVALGLAPPIFLVVGIIDAAGAVWTWLALRRGNQQTAGA
jgi:hypothetical protein